VEKKTIIAGVITAGILFIAVLLIVLFSSNLIFPKVIPRTMPLLIFGRQYDTTDSLVLEDGLFGYSPKSDQNKSLPWGCSIAESQERLNFQFFEEECRQHENKTIFYIENIPVTQINHERKQASYSMYTDLELTYESDSLEKVSFIASFKEECGRILLDLDGHPLPERPEEELNEMMEMYWPEISFVFYKYIGEPEMVSETEHFWRRENTELRLKLDTEAKELIITLSRIS